MEALTDNIDRVQAERALVAAQAALYPHMKADAGRQWWQATMRLTQYVAHSVGQAARQLFTLNGRALDHRQMKRQLGQQLGGGFEAE